jgi:hypothetical protein
MKDVPRITSEEIKAIFKFYIHANSIQKLKLLPNSKVTAEGSREFVWGVHTAGRFSETM